MEQRKRVIVTFSNRTIVRTLLWVIAAYTSYKFIGRVSHVITLVFAALFLALALNPAVMSLRRRLRLKSRVRATAVAYLLIVAFLTAFFSFVIPPLVSQTRDFIQSVPQTVSNFQNQDTNLSRTIKKYHLDQKIDQGAKDFASNYGSFGTKILDTGRRLGEALASFLAVLVMAFMMLVEGPKWVETYFRALPASRRAHHQQISIRVYKAVTGFVNGQVILAAIAGLFAFVALEIAGHVMGEPTNAVALAGIVAVFGIIPLFGNPIAATVVVLASLLNSSTLAIVMAIYFVVYFFIENHTFQPYLQSKLNDLTPLTVFIAALMGVGFAGILGAIIAIPAAATVKILIEDYFQRHKLNAET